MEVLCHFSTKQITGPHHSKMSTSAGSKALLPSSSNAMDLQGDLERSSKFLDGLRTVRRLVQCIPNFVYRNPLHYFGSAPWL